MLETIAPGFSPVPVATLLDEAVSRFAQHTAIDFLGRRYSYREVGQLTERAAAGLQALGVGKGTKVGLCLPNTPYSVIMYFAVLKTGATVLNFNPLYTAHEMELMLRDTGCQMIVTIDAAPVFETVRILAGKGRLARVIVCSLAAALPALKGVALKLFKPGALAKIPAAAPYMRFEALLTHATAPFRPVEIDPLRDVAVLQFTGGTTGVPKAAMLSHANVTVNVHQVQAILPPLVPGAERFLGILPFFHVFAMTAVMNLGLAIGAELILLPKPEIGEIMKTLYARKPTIVPGVPTLFTAISTAAEASGRGDLSFIKFFVSGGAPLSVEVMERFERISKSRILEGYGLSETAPALTFSRPDMIKHGSVGPAIPGTEIQIRDPANPEIVLPQGARGEICARGPQVMLGYYNQPEETAYAFTDGFFRTGDIGYLDEDGCLFIVDRIKDLIICSGFNVYPRVIEEAAYQHPAVAEAIAVGIPDPYRGQAPKLYVTLRAGFEATTGDDILEFLKDKLNKIEMPKKVEIRAALPKTMVGKLSKKELLAEEQQAHKP